MGLEVDSEDVEELVQDYRSELTTKEFVYVQINNKRIWLRNSLLKMRKKKKSVSQVLQLKKFVLNGLMCKHLWKNITLIPW